MISLTWVIGIIGTLGIAGTIAAVILVPGVAIPILQSLTAFILRCKPCLWVLSIALALFIGAIYGGRVESAKCRAGELAAQLAAQQADLDNARKSAADEAARATTIEANANDQAQKDAAYIEMLKLRPACALDDSDIDGVSNRQSRAYRAKPAAGAR